jgi:predicted dehydrogenase
MAASSISRRGFVRGLSASLAAPYVITSTALGAAGKPAASERIAMGAIGIGGRGTQVIGDFMAYEEVQMVAVCDTQRGRRQKAKQKVDQRYDSQDCATYIDLRELLARDDIDAVLIATGENWHALASILAAKAGKDIYSEKPPAHTIAEGRALVETVKRYGTVYQCGTQRRSIPRFRFAVELAHSGKLGQLKNVYAEASGKIAPPRAFVLAPQPEPPREELDWDLWLGPAPWRPFSRGYLGGWKGHIDFQWGTIAEWCSHTADLCQFAVDADNTGPLEWEYDGKTITGRYASGVNMVITDGAWPLHVRFEGTEGWVHVDDDGGIETEPKSLLAERRFGKGYPAGNHVRNFLDCVRSRKTPTSYAEATHRSMTTCIIANICLMLGRKLSWDPVQEEFVGDQDANRMRARAMRDPWTL